LAISIGIDPLETLVQSIQRRKLWSQDIMQTSFKTPQQSQTMRAAQGQVSQAMRGAQGQVQTLYLAPSDVAQIVRRHGVGKVAAGMAAYIREDFLRWAQFDKSARTAAHSATGVIELMPTADDQLYSFKYVNGHPGNGAFGLPTVMAFGVLADVATGAPMVFSELTLTTALRTAAMSALAAKSLARANSHTMAIIGNGAQSEFQAFAFAQMLGIKTFHLFDVDAAATQRLQRNLERAGLTVKTFASTREAVRGCDIVTTVTADKKYATILTADMIEPGMHINGVGGDCPGKTELAAGVLERASVFVEFEPQTRIEGDIQQMPADFAVTELWRVFGGEAVGRTSQTEVTVFDSVGFAVEDFAALRFMKDAALEMGLGQTLELIAQSADPKDLFGVIGASEAATVEALV
jgi:ornithine cyclodeaminase